MPFDIAGTVLNKLNTYQMSNYSLVADGLQIFLSARLTESYPGTGTTWYDLSGNGRNFTWVSSPSYTAGTYFSTLGNRCQGPASNSVGINNTSGYTVFLLAKQNALVATAAFKFYGAGASGSTRGIFSHCTWSNDRIYFDQGGCCNADTRLDVDSGGTTTTLWGVYGFRRLTNSSTRNIFKDGVSVATNTNTALDINLNTTLIDLGSSDEYGGNSSTWNAQLAAFAVYNRGLTDAEVLQTSQALRNLHGVP